MDSVIPSLDLEIEGRIAGKSRCDVLLCQITWKVSLSERLSRLEWPVDIVPVSGMTHATVGGTIP